MSIYFKFKNNWKEELSYEFFDQHARVCDVLIKYSDKIVKGRRIKENKIKFYGLFGKELKSVQIKLKRKGTFIDKLFKEATPLDLLKEKIL